MYISSFIRRSLITFPKIDIVALYKKIYAWFIVFKAISTIFQLYRGGQVYWWRKPEYPEKTMDLPQVTNKLVTLNRLSEIRTHNVSGYR